MAAQGDGKGGYSITSTSAYQTLFTSTAAADGGSVLAYQVKPLGEDALVQVTYENNDVRVFNAPNGDWTPIIAPSKASRIRLVEAKGETGTGVPIYGNVLVP